INGFHGLDGAIGAGHAHDGDDADAGYERKNLLRRHHRYAIMRTRFPAAPLAVGQDSAARRETRYSKGLTPQANSEQQKQPPRVSVVVVSRNRAAMLRRCLESIEASDAEYVFFLHDDTEVQPTTIDLLADALDTHADAAAVCPMLVDEQGQPAPQLGSLPPTGVWRPATPGAPVAVEFPRGAALMLRVYFIKAIRQIDERYGQFGSDADLAAEIRRASRKILLMPAASVRHQGRSSYTSMEWADFLSSRAVFLGKYEGFLAGIKARIAAVLGGLAAFRLGELKYAIAGQKIDGTQE